MNKFILGGASSSYSSSYQNISITSEPNHSVNFKELKDKFQSLKIYSKSDNELWLTLLSGIDSGSFDTDHYIVDYNESSDEIEVYYCDVFVVLNTSKEYREIAKQNNRPKPVIGDLQTFDLLKNHKKVDDRIILYQTDSISKYFDEKHNEKRNYFKNKDILNVCNNHAPFLKSISPLAFKETISEQEKKNVISVQQYKRILQRIKNK